MQSPRPILSNDPRVTSLRAKLTFIAETDSALYARVVRYRDKLIKNGGLSARARNTLREAINYSFESLLRDCTPAELRYVELRYRHQFTAREALREARVPSVVTEDIILLSRPVQERIDRLQRELANQINITRGDVAAGLMNAVTVSRDATELVMAWREIGKLLGYYEETKIRIEQNVKQEIKHTHTLEGMDLTILSDAELLKHAPPDLLSRLQPPAARTIEHVPAAQLASLNEHDVLHTPEFIEVPVNEPRAEPSADDIVLDATDDPVRMVGGRLR